jgi:cell division protein FtsW
VGVVPPTGITLPFFSYGGTANLFFLIAVGIILAVSRTGVSRKKITYID